MRYADSAIRSVQDCPGTSRTVFDSPLGQWSYSSAPPPAELADVVHCFWETHGFADYSREKILPRGTVEIIVNLGPPHRTLDVNFATVDTFRSAWLSGLQESALIAAPTYNTAEVGSMLIGASLNACGVYSLFGVPGSLFSNTVVELSELLPPSQIEILREQLFEAGDTLARITAVAGLLTAQRRRHGKAPSTSIIGSLRCFRRSFGTAQVRDLCTLTGISRKHLAARFQCEVGISPKRYARILRFARLIEWLGGTERPNWAELAVACGYYDQAHLVREFRSFSGETPTQFMRVRSPDGRSILYD